ncbi:hypothetical protein BT69DRAFT_1295659 [Atractiella rhizophila]|nr:hypothetical protein BT69DRAFT_1295659 [Atractiella rhizophila]
MDGNSLGTFQGELSDSFMGKKIISGRDRDGGREGTFIVIAKEDENSRHFDIKTGTPLFGFSLEEAEAEMKMSDFTECRDRDMETPVAETTQQPRQLTLLEKTHAQLNAATHMTNTRLEALVRTYAQLDAAKPVTQRPAPLVRTYAQLNLGPRA